MRSVLGASWCWEICVTMLLGDTLAWHTGTRGVTIHPFWSGTNLRICSFVLLFFKPFSWARLRLRRICTYNGSEALAQAGRHGSLYIHKRTHGEVEDGAPRRRASRGTTAAVPRRWDAPRAICAAGPRSRSPPTDLVYTAQRDRSPAAGFATLRTTMRL